MLSVIVTTHLVEFLVQRNDAVSDEFDVSLRLNLLMTTTYHTNEIIQRQTDFCRLGMLSYSLAKETIFLSFMFFDDFRPSHHFAEMIMICVQIKFANEKNFGVSFDYFLLFQCVVVCVMDV